MERKEFLKRFAVGGSVLLAAPALFNSCSDDDGDDDDNGGNNPNEIIIDLTLPAYDDLGDVGGFAYKNEIIIFRTGDTTYMAVSKVCTHSGCTITYDHGGSELPCPCHGSTFSTSGTVTNGPAATNLKKYNVVKDGNTLKIT